MLVENNSPFPPHLPHSRYLGADFAGEEEDSDSGSSVSAEETAARCGCFFEAAAGWAAGVDATGVLGKNIL